MAFKHKGFWQCMDTMRDKNFANLVKRKKLHGKFKNFYNKKNSCHWCNRFKGSWLCSWLLKLGSKVYGTGNNPNKNKNLF